MWDGHHRLLGARLLDIATVPVEYGHGGIPDPVDVEAAGLFATGHRDKSRSTHIGGDTVRETNDVEDQAWFWTPEWQDGEREASAELAAGEGTFYEDVDALLAAMSAPDDEPSHRDGQASHQAEVE